MEGGASPAHLAEWLVRLAGAGRIGITSRPILPRRKGIVGPKKTSGSATRHSRSQVCREASDNSAGMSPFEGL